MTLKVIWGVWTGVAHGVLAELAMDAVTGEPGSVFVAAAAELATVAELDVKDMGPTAVAEPVVAP